MPKWVTSLWLRFFLRDWRITELKQLKNAEQQMMEDCRAYVHDNPITSLGIAVAVGFLLSRVLSGR